MADYAEGPMGEKSKRVKKYEPEDKDYTIEDIRISEAENGVVIECCYALKEEVKDKMRKKGAEMGNHFSPYEYEHRDKHVFQSKQEALSFITSELNSMWGSE